MNKGIIQVDGKFYKKYKVVMLSTDKESVIQKSIKGDLKYQPGKRQTIDLTGCSYKDQHLYILSEEEIKKGEWAIGSNNSNGKIIDFEDCEPFIAKSNYAASIYALKIIATTNPELGYGDEFGGFYQLPRPSDAFLKAYCDKDEVLIELTWTNKRISIGHTIREDYRPKVAKDNTISIKPLEDS